MPRKQDPFPISEFIKYWLLSETLHTTTYRHNNRHGENSRIDIRLDFRIERYHQIRRLKFHQTMLLLKPSTLQLTFKPTMERLGTGAGCTLALLR
jgi:hypothetical protein